MRGGISIFEPAWNKQVSCSQHRFSQYALCMWLLIMLMCMFTWMDPETWEIRKKKRKVKSCVTRVSSMNNVYTVLVGWWRGAGCSLHTFFQLGVSEQRNWALPCAISLVTRAIFPFQVCAHVQVTDARTDGQSDRHTDRHWIRVLTLEERLINKDEAILSNSISS